MLPHGLLTPRVESVRKSVELLNGIMPRAPYTRGYAERVRVPHSVLRRSSFTAVPMCIFEYGRILYISRESTNAPITVFILHIYA